MFFCNLLANVSDRDRVVFLKESARRHAARSPFFFYPFLGALFRRPRPPVASFIVRARYSPSGRGRTSGARAAYI